MKKQPEEPFHPLARQMSNSPGTALASAGDTTSTATRTFTLRVHGGNITWCEGHVCRKKDSTETAGAEFSHLVNQAASSPGSLLCPSRSFSTQQANKCSQMSPQKPAMTTCTSRLFSVLCDVLPCLFLLGALILLCNHIQY